MQKTTQSNIYLCFCTTQKLDNTILIHKSESQFNTVHFLHNATNALGFKWGGTGEPEF